MNNITISESIKYIGVDDTTLDLFESQYIWGVSQVLRSTV